MVNLVRLQFVSAVSRNSLYYSSLWCSAASFLRSDVYCPGCSKSVWTVGLVFILSGGLRSADFVLQSGFLFLLHSF